MQDRGPSSMQNTIVHDLLANTANYSRACITCRLACRVCKRGSLHSPAREGTASTRSTLAAASTTFAALGTSSSGVVAFAHSSMVATRAAFTAACWSSWSLAASAWDFQTSSAFLTSSSSFASVFCSSPAALSAATFLAWSFSDPSLYSLILLLRFSTLLVSFHPASPALVSKKRIISSIL